MIFFLVFKDSNPSWIGNVGINGWLEIARNVVSGHGYSSHELLTYFQATRLQPTAARSPLPVLVLSALIFLFGNNYGILFAYSWALSAATAVALYFLSKKIFLREKMAWATALLYCFYIPEMCISTGYAAASESLFTLLLIGYFLTVLKNIETKKKSWAALAGFFLGCACLCRPVVLFLPALYVVWILRTDRAKAVSSAVLFSAVFCACLCPWAVRNQMVFQKPILTSTLGGYNLLRHNEMIEKNEFSIYTWNQFDPIARKAVAERGEDFDRLNETQLDRILAEKAVGIIKAYPLRYLKLCALRCVWLWYKVTGEEPLALGQNIVIYVFMFPGILLAFFRKHFLTFFAWHILYFVLFYALINVQFRFICPLMPYGIMLAVYAAFSMFSFFRPLERKSF